SSYRRIQQQAAFRSRMPRSGCRCRCIPAPSVIIARWGFCAKPRALSSAEPRTGQWGRGVEHSWDDPDEEKTGCSATTHHAFGRSVERCAHALPDRLVPGMPIHLDVDIGRLPEVELGDVRAGAITARDKRRALLLDGLERRNNVLAAVDAGGIALWSDQ